MLSDGPRDDRRPQAGPRLAASPGAGTRVASRARASDAQQPDPRAVSDASRLGQRIATLRRASGWSQRRLAEAAGVSHGYIALLELGRLPSPGKFRLDAVARALNLRTADALLAPALPYVEPPPGGLAPFRHAADEAQSRTSRRADNARPPTNTPPGSAQPLANVVGSLDQLRSPTAHLLPVFRWGSCGDPRDRESPPDPDHLEYPPPGRESLIGPHGFGVMVKGDSMAARGIFDGDVVWVNPERAYQLGKVVLALVSDASGESGMVVKTYARTEVGECLVSETAQGRSPVVCREFRVIGPVVGITSWRLPT
jgi:SOS-response transcriptional repressor LexA